jgi:hypothetical protein
VKVKDIRSPLRLGPNGAESAYFPNSHAVGSPRDDPDGDDLAGSPRARLRGHRERRPSSAARRRRRLNLTQAAIYLARAPKSNAVITALSEAAKDVREVGHTRPPDELRDAHYEGAKKLGRGKGYMYPHSDPRGFEVDYLPEPLKGKKYYRPSGSGEEEGENGD